MVRKIVIFAVKVTSTNFKIFAKMKPKIASGARVLYSNIPKNLGE